MQTALTIAVVIGVIFVILLLIVFPLAYFVEVSDEVDESETADNNIEDAEVETVDEAIDDQFEK